MTVVSGNEIFNWITKQYLPLTNKFSFNFHFFPHRSLSLFFYSSPFLIWSLSIWFDVMWWDLIERIFIIFQFFSVFLTFSIGFIVLIRNDFCRRLTKPFCHACFRGIWCWIRCFWTFDDDWSIFRMMCNERFQLILIDRRTCTSFEC